MRLRLVSLALLASISPLAAATFYIDPSAAGTNSGTLANPWTSWTGHTMTAGNTYLQKTGTTYGATLTVNGVAGTVGSPVTISSYDPGGVTPGTGTNPILNQLVVNNSSWVTFDHLSLAHGFLSQAGTVNDHITLQNYDLQNPASGVLNNGDGLDLRDNGTNFVARNGVIHNVNRYCFDLFQPNHASGNGVQFLNNQVFGCGVYGIEVYSSDWNVISGNVVHDTGVSGGAGGSAIHVENQCWPPSPPAPSQTPCGPSAAHNTLTNNVAYNANDSGGDGNGFQMDLDVSFTTGSNNLSFANTGSGFDILNSRNGTYNNNVALLNGLNRVVNSHSLCSEFTFDEFPAGTTPSGTNNSNTVTNNQAIVSTITFATGTPPNVPHTCSWGGPAGFEWTAQGAGGNNVTGPNTLGSNHVMLATPNASQHLYHIYNSGVGDNITTWNGGAGIAGGVLQHSSNDTFGSGVSLIATGATVVDFVFPPPYDQMQVLNPATSTMVTLYGWKADRGDGIASLYYGAPTAGGAGLAR
jgi:parallel beta-helix repeat protein